MPRSLLRKAVFPIGFLLCLVAFSVVFVGAAFVFHPVASWWADGDRAAFHAAWSLLTIVVGGAAAYGALFFTATRTAAVYDTLSRTGR